MNEVCFWHADKQSVLQVDTTILAVCGQAYPKYPKWEVCISLQYLKEHEKDEVHFLPRDKHQKFLQINTNISSAWPDMPKSPEITSLLFLCKKEVSDGIDSVIFDGDRQAFLKFPK